MPRSRHTSNEIKVSRRKFARGAAFAAAAAAIPRDTRNVTETRSDALSQDQSARATQLSPVADAQLQTILAKYGKRLSEEQKTELKRLLTQAQKTSDALRSFPLDNSNDPAMIFRVYRSDK